MKLISLPHVTIHNKALINAYIVLICVVDYINDAIVEKDAQSIL